MFLSVELGSCPCCSYVKLKVSGPGQFCLVLLNLMEVTGRNDGSMRLSSFFRDKNLKLSDLAAVQSWSVETGILCRSDST